MTNIPVYSYINKFNNHFGVARCTYICFSLQLDWNRNNDCRHLKAITGPYGNMFLKKKLGHDCSDVAIFWDTWKLSLFFTKLYGIRSLYPRVLILTLGMYFLSNMNNLIVRKGNMAQIRYQPQNGSKQAIIDSLWYYIRSCTFNNRLSLTSSLGIRKEVTFLKSTKLSTNKIWL